jgi:hypothetical protein
MTLKQVKWCNSHDWYLDCIHGVTGYLVTVKDDISEGNTLQFTSFNKLKIWAGY